MLRDGYLFSILLSGTCYLFLFAYSFRFRKSREWIFFIVISALLTIQALASLLELHASDLEAKLVWRNIQQIPLYSSPLLLLGMIMSFIGISRKTVIQRMVMLGSIIILYWILLFTDSQHHLIRESVMLEAYGQSERIVIERTALAFFLLVYNYLLGLAGLVLLLINFRRASGIQRTQYILLIVAILSPYMLIFMGNLIGWQITVSVSMLPTAALFFYALFMHRFLQIRPIAKEKVLEHMTEGILIVEEQDIVIDANPAALPIAEKLWGSAKLEGAYMPELLEVDPSLLAFYQAKEQGEQEVRSGDRLFAVRLVPIQVRNKRTGTLVILTDITERKKFEDQLFRQATRDDLTQLFNRKYFMELLEKGMKACRLAKEPISLMLIDLDYFKSINDKYGHLVGDRVLEHFAGLLKEVVTKKAVSGRIGGEEFAVFLPGLTESMAYETAEKLRLRVQQEPLQMADLADKVFYTISVGIAELNDPFTTLEDWYHQADTNLYASKRNGRNRTTMLAR